MPINVWIKIVLCVISNLYQKGFINYWVNNYFDELIKGVTLIERYLHLDFTTELLQNENNSCVERITNINGLLKYIKLNYRWQLQKNIYTCLKRTKTEYICNYKVERGCKLQKCNISVIGGQPNSRPFNLLIMRTIFWCIKPLRGHLNIRRLSPD